MKENVWIQNKLQAYIATSDISQVLLALWLVYLAVRIPKHTAA